MILGCLLVSMSLLPQAVGTRAVYLDGGEPRTVIRRARIADGRREVSLLHPRTGVEIPASLGDEALVQLAPGATLESLRTAGLTPIREVSSSLHLWQVRGRRGEDGLTIAARLVAERGTRIIAAAPDLAFPHVRTSSAFTPPPDDPRYAGQWFFARLGMNDAWARETGSASTTVVVIDDGCDLAHPDLVAKLDPGLDVFSMDADPSYLPNSPTNNHGTACAGLVGAATNNGVGVAGACPGCRMRCVRLLGGDGVEIPISTDIAAFQFVIDTGAAVASNSWGYKVATPVPDMLRQILEKVYDTGRGGKGAIAVFAAGNDDRELFDDEIEAVRGVVNVGAVDNFGELTAYSNHGASVDLVAPTGTLSTDISGADGSDPGDYTSTFSGTSSACPIVAGVLGLMASAAPEKTSAQLVEALLASAKQSQFATPDAKGHDAYYGRGELRPRDALKVLAGEVLDGGTGDGGENTEDAGGCSYTRGPGEQGVWALALVAAFAWRLKRQKARREIREAFCVEL